MIGSVRGRSAPGRMTLARLGIVSGVLLGGLLIGWLSARLRRPEILAALGFLLVAGPLLLTHGRIDHGVLGIVVAAAVIRFSLPTGTQSRIVMSLVMTAGVLAVWIGRMLVQTKRLRLRPAPTNAPLLGFILVCVISYAWSNAFRDPLVITWRTWPVVQLGGLAVMVLLPGAFLVTANCLQETKWVMWLTVIFLAVGTMAIVAHFWRLPVAFLEVRPLFPTLVISLAYALALFHRQLPWPLRLLLLVLAGAWYYRVFVQNFRWLSSWMPVVVAVAVISLLRSRRLFALLVIVFAVYVLLNWAPIEARMQQESRDSGETRLDAYLHNWRVTREHLLFGVGPAGYAVYYMTYFPMEAMASHNTYIDILSQTGIVGLSFFLWFFVALARTVWRLWRQTRGRFDFENAFTVAVMGGYAGTILAMGLGDWIIPFVYTQTIAGFDYAAYTWVLLGAATSLYHILANSEREGA